MAKGGAGALSERVSFSKRGEVEDSYGNTVSDWILQFETAAAFVHLRGGEAVIAARLENRHPQVVRIRNSQSARSITAEWKMNDARSGTEYAIRDITPTVDRKWIDLLCESGVVP